MHTVEHPANNRSFWGLLYNKSYITAAPLPASHYGKNGRKYRYKSIVPTHKKISIVMV